MYEDYFEINSGMTVF